MRAIREERHFPCPACNEDAGQHVIGCVMAATPPALVHVYQTIPTRVHAVRWDGSAEALAAIQTWVPGTGRAGLSLVIPWVLWQADLGDLVVRTSSGEVLIYHPEAFVLKYQLVEED